MVADGMDYERDHQIGLGEVARRLQRIEDAVGMVRKELGEEMSSTRGDFNTELNKLKEWNELHNNDLARELNELRVKVQVLEVTLRLKSGLWGAGSGILAALLSVLTYVLAHTH